MRLRQFLEQTVLRETEGLRAIPEDLASAVPAGGGWSRKEELGHLIDSAANNHVRFVRATLEGHLTIPGYDQNGWVKLHGYKEMPWADLVIFWEGYNRLLIALVGRISQERREAQCVISGAAPVSLAFLIEDYVVHMQHHIDHILGRT